MHSRLVCAIVAGQDVPNHGDVHVREAEQLSKLPQGAGRPIRAQNPRRHRQASGDDIQGMSSEMCCFLRSIVNKN